VRRIAPLLLAIACAAPVRAADPSHAVDARVRDLVYAADDAYRDGRYEEAADAFEEAYRVHPQPALLFNVGKCHEKVWIIKAREGDLRAAVDAYRRYLAVVDRASPKSRHAEAELALERLSPALEKATPAAAGSSSLATKTPARATRLMVGASVAGATVRIDDGAPRPLPLLEQVTAGKHRVRIACTEHLEEDREVFAADGELTPVHAELRPSPGELVVRAPEGTAVYVDGRFSGRTPLTAPLRLAPGDHDVALLDGGRVPWGRRVAIARAASVTVEGEPKRSPYRWASFALAGLAVLAGGGAAYEATTAVLRDVRIQRFLASRERGDYLDERDLAAYADNVSVHDEAQSRALTLAIVSSVLGLGAAGLYFIDKPTVADVVYEHDAEPPAKATPVTPTVSLAPAFGATSAAIDVVVRF
jgi:hypothetical protein